MHNIPLMTATQAKRLKAGFFAVGGLQGLYLKKRKDKDPGAFVLRYTDKFGERHDLVVGHYPTMTLQGARLEAIDLTRRILNGEDILAKRKAQRAQKAKQKKEQARKKLTFEQVAEAWIDNRVATNFWKNNATGERVARNQLKKYVYPQLGRLQIDKVTPQLVAACLGPIWNTVHSTATKIRGNLFQIFRWAIAMKHCHISNPVNPQGDLGVLLENLNHEKKPQEHHPACSPEEIPQLFFELNEMSTMSNYLCMFSILTATRSKAARLAKWSEIDREAKTWVIPAENDKIKSVNRDRTIYLSDEVLELLDRLPRFPNNDYLFSNCRGEPLSVNAPTEALKKLSARRKARDDRGWIDPKNSKVISLHGTARSSFRTWAKDDKLGNNRRFDQEAVELCLLHDRKDPYRGAYDRSTLVRERQFVMSEWGKYCFSLLKK